MVDEKDVLKILREELRQSHDQLQIHDRSVRKWGEGHNSDSCARCNSIKADTYDRLVGRLDELANQWKQEQDEET